MRIVLLAAAIVLAACNKDGKSDSTPVSSQAEGLGSAPPPPGSGPPPGGSARPGPPAEAIAACASASAGAACTVKMGDKDMKGTCQAGPDGKLGCRPEGGPGHGGPPPGAAPGH